MTNPNQITLTPLNQITAEGEGYFTWGYFLAFAAFGLHTIQCPYQVIKTYHAARDKSAGLRGVLDDEKGRMILEEYLIGEWSVENLRFWIEADNFEQNYNEGSESDKKWAFEIYSTFIPLNAFMQVNLKDKVREAIMQEVDSKTYSKDMFKEAKQEIFTLMSKDSFPRFEKSQEYMDYLGGEKNNVINMVVLPIKAVAKRTR